ncbi:MAG: ribonuclease III [Rickettsiales bacterium]|nr:ribonuclease III [Rickettsiales bacterium]
MKKLNYTFTNPALFDLAMVQSGANAAQNNERLEFLGDRVLGLAVAELLYKMFQGESEGDLAKRHAALVSTNTLAVVAREFGFDKLIKHGHMTGGKMNHIAANATEAVLGAIYLDGGFDAARAVVIDAWTDIATAAAQPPVDFKTALQELVQRMDSGALPVYEYTSGSGKNHSPVFNVRVAALGKSAEGSGSTKKSAGAAAAEKLLGMLKK